MCSGWRPLDLAWVRREVLPSIATMSGSPSRRPLTQAMKHSENSFGFERIDQVVERIVAGDAVLVGQEAAEEIHVGFAPVL